jgi:hypothetical protein
MSHMDIALLGRQSRSYLPRQMASSRFPDAESRNFRYTSVPLSPPQVCPGTLSQATVPSKYLVEFTLFKLFEIQQGVVGARRRAQQLVQLHLNGFGIAVLGSLNEEDHQEGDDRGASIDHELPGIAEPKQGAVTSQTRITLTARMKAKGLPVARAVAFARRVNCDRDLAGA